MEPTFIPLAYEKPSGDAVAARARLFYEQMSRRRSVRAFSSEPVPREVINDLVRAASTAPSGAHQQPWTFVAVSDPVVKREIRVAAEQEEQKNYGGRMPDDWLRALEPIGTDARKPFLEQAPWLVVLFRQDYEFDDQGGRRHHYYVAESVGIAAGVFLTAVHQSGLVALTHTPSPMGFLKRILKRPESETASLLIPVGYPASDAEVPDLNRKPLEQVLVTISGHPVSR